MHSDSHLEMQLAQIQLVHCGAMLIRCFWIEEIFWHLSAFPFVNDSLHYSETSLTGFELWSQDFVLVVVYQQYIPFIISVKKLHFFWLFFFLECFCFPTFFRSFSYLFISYAMIRILLKSILFSSIMQTCIFMNNIFNFLNISQFIFRTFLHALCLHENSMNSLVFLYIHVDKNQGVHLLYMACVRCWGLTFLFSSGNLKSVLANHILWSRIWVCLKWVAAGLLVLDSKLQFPVLQNHIHPLQLH